MDPTVELIMRILGFILAGIGLVIVYAAPKIVDRRGLAAKKEVDPRVLEHLPAENLEKYKRDAAILDVKLRGLIFAAPGFVLILIAFR
jgi:hypothetical protein